MTGFGWLHPKAVTATYIAVKMMPECTFTVHADCGVRIVPRIGGILKTPSTTLFPCSYSYNLLSRILLTTNNTPFTLCTIRHLSLEGYVEEAALQ